MQLGIAAPHRLGEFVGIHSIALKSLVLHDDELARFITRWLPVETSLGLMSIDELVRNHPSVRYAESLDEFRQIAGIARPDNPVVNGGYVYDSEIIRILPSLFDGVTVERVNVVTELDDLAAPPLADRALTNSLEERASAALASVGCAVVVRTIDQPDLSGVYVADPEVLRSMDRSRARGISGGTWGGVMGKVEDFSSRSRAASSQPDAAARLCLNWSNRVVRMLATLGDDTVFDRSVHVLYVQALLAGHRPLSTADRALMTTAMTDLIQLSVGLGDTIPEETAP